MADGVSCGLSNGVGTNSQISFENYELSNISEEKEIKLLEETTADVWNHINATQDNYHGTILPRSFTIETTSGNMWTHGNATKHMYEALTSIKESPMLKNSNPRLYTQFILYDYYKQLNEAVKSGIIYNKIINTSHWEFVFAPPRSKGDSPVIKHARFLGLNK